MFHNGEKNDKKSNKSFKGATVMKGIFGLHKMVTVVDFNSLYPSIIISHNLCYSTYMYTLLFTYKECKDKPISVFDKEKQYVTIYIKSDDLDDDSVVLAHRFTLKKTGIVSNLLKDLLDSRKATKKLYEQQSDPAVKLNLDSKQKAEKIAANSIYGILGTKNKVVSLLAAAESTTAVGRYYIECSKDIFENELDCKVVYGDTDSCFVVHNNTSKNISKDNKETIVKPVVISDKNVTARAVDENVTASTVDENVTASTVDDIYKSTKDYMKQCCDIITSRFPTGVQLSYEETYKTLILCSKKVYVAVNKNNKKLYKGTPNVKKQNSLFVQNVYSDVVDYLLNNDITDENEIYIKTNLSDIFIKHIDFLIGEEIPLSDLIEINKYSTDVRSDISLDNAKSKRVTLTALQRFVLKQRKLGYVYAPGNIISTICIIHYDSKLKGDKMEHSDNVTWDMVNKYYYVNRVSESLKRLAIIPVVKDVISRIDYIYEKLVMKHRTILSEDDVF